MNLVLSISFTGKIFLDSLVVPFVKILRLIVAFLVNTLKIKISSFQNKFFVRIKGKRKLLSKFHGLYYACFMLAKGMSDDIDIFEDNDANAFDVNKINNPQKNRIRQGSIFTMLLNSIDIDFINDMGSKTLHDHEPIQAVYLNSSKIIFFKDYT